MTGKILDPSSHPKKEVRDVLVKWVSAGFELHDGTHFGLLRCTCANLCTSISVWRTPQNAGSHARKIDRMASRCPRPADDPGRSLAGRPRND